MKIVFLASAGSIHSYRWIKYFANRGHQVYWISFAESSFENLPGVHYYEIRQVSQKIASTIQSIIAVKRLLSKIRPNIVHAHYAGTYGLAGALCRYSPFVLTAWGSDILYASKLWIKELLVKYILKRANLVTCDAYHMVNAMARLGCNKRKIRIIYFGIDTNHFSPREKNEILKKNLGLDQCPAIISLRSFYPVYDVESLVKAGASVLENIPEAKFILAGGGPQESMLKSLAQELGIFENFKFVGIIQNHILPEYLSASDVYVSTALSDAGIAASTAEAMACGLPVIITDTGENERWVRNGEGGFVVPAKNPEILAQKIIFLLKNPDLCKKYGQINRMMIKTKNDYYEEMGKMENCYQELLTTRTASISRC